MADENDNAPRFVGNGKPIVAVIPNTANFGYPVTTVVAADDDVGLNAEIRYSLLNEPSKLFEIDGMSGSIRVLGPINSGDQRVYGFDVKATDRRGGDDGKSSITNVFVSDGKMLKLNFPKKILHCISHDFHCFFCNRFMCWTINVKCVSFYPEHQLKLKKK